MPEDELTVEVTVTPRQSRNLAIAVALISVVMIVLPFVSENARHGNPVFGLGGLIYAVYLAHRARRGITVTTLRIDRAGLTTRDGLYDCTWDRAILLWVGSSWGLLGQPQLLVYTRAGVSFARRSRTSLHPERMASLSRRLTGPEFCARLSAITGVRVVDGTVVSRRRAEQDLLDATPG